MRSDLEHFKDRWRRYGTAGFLTKAVLKAGEEAVGLSVEVQYSAALDSVLAALDSAEGQSSVTIRVLRGRKKRIQLWNRLRELNPGMAVADLSDFDRVAIAEVSHSLVGFWCFTLRETNVYERGVMVSPKMRGQGLARALLKATIESLDVDLEKGRLVATTDVSNRSSRRMLEGCGLQPEGIMTKGRLPLMGRFHFLWTPLG